MAPAANLINWTSVAIPSPYIGNEPAIAPNALEFEPQVTYMIVYTILARALIKPMYMAAFGMTRPPNTKKVKSKGSISTKF